MADPACKMTDLGPLGRRNRQVAAETMPAEKPCVLDRETLQPLSPRVGLEKAAVAAAGTLTSWR